MNTRNMLTFITIFIDNNYSMLKKVWALYYDGFRNMPRWGKILWTVILVKLFVMFIVFKLFLMPNYLNSRFDSAEEKSDYVLEQLTTKP